MSNPRNKPCACGSGKKFKKCCWTPRAWPEYVPPTKEQFEATQQKIKETEADVRQFRRAGRSINAAVFIAAITSMGWPLPSRKP